MEAAVLGSGVGVKAHAIIRNRNQNLSIGFAGGDGELFPLLPPTDAVANRVFNHRLKGQGGHKEIGILNVIFYVSILRGCAQNLHTSNRRRKIYTYGAPYRKNAHLRFGGFERFLLVEMLLQSLQNTISCSGSAGDFQLLRDSTNHCRELTQRDYLIIVFYAYRFNSAIEAFR